jgi:hypothetical protein
MQGKQKNITEEYKKITERLKKRMFQKVNYSSVSDNFEKLGIELQRTEQMHYSAFCMIAAAKYCEYYL